MKTYTNEIEELRAANAALIASNATLRRQRNEASAELKLRKEDIARQWAVNTDLKSDLARVTSELEAQATIAIGRGELLTQAEACIRDREEQLARVAEQLATANEFAASWVAARDENDTLRARVVELEKELVGERKQGGSHD